MQHGHLAQSARTVGLFSGARPHHLCRQAIDFREGLRGGRVLTDNRGLPPLVRAVGPHNAKHRKRSSQNSIAGPWLVTSRCSRCLNYPNGSMKWRDPNADASESDAAETACAGWHVVQICAVKPAGTMRTFPSLIARRRSVKIRHVGTIMARRKRLTFPSHRKARCAAVWSECQ